MRLLCVFILMLSAGTGWAQKEVLSHIPATGKSHRDFIPKGYDTISWGESVAIGDLNKDGFDDVVIVLKNAESEEKDVDENRLLLVLFNNGSEYHLQTVATRVVMCHGCGGVYGDPFVGVFIKKGVITVSHYGGSAWRWSKDTKFRYQNGDFYLIGQTDDYYSTLAECGDIGIGDAGRNYEDINYITGERYRRKTTEDCKVLLDKRDKIKIKPLEKMVDSKVIDN